MKGFEFGRMAGVVAALAVIAICAAAPSLPDYERSPINYSHTAAHDAVARLLQRIATGEIKLAGSDRDILRSVLRELAVPEASQLLVFSKTSSQAGLISPNNPRALYFSDSIYVGYVPGGLIETAAIDPQLGPVFYSFDPQDARDARRTFVRETSCLRCHGSPFSREIPTLFTRSVIASSLGDVLSPRDRDLVDEQTPFNSRWGGWYITGFTGAETHRGNAVGSEREGKIVFVPSDKRPMELTGRVDTAKYLAATSDVLAALVFQHQLDMHNSLTRATQRYRRALPAATAANSRELDQVLSEGATDIVDHLLFRGAAPLPSGIEGSSAFREAFLRDAPRSHHGDALKDFSAADRLFANRCSFLIYSEPFHALPAPLKTRVLVHLGSALRNDESSPRYAYLEAAERRRILEILTETLPEAQAQLISAVP